MYVKEIFIILDRFPAKTIEKGQWNEEKIINVIKKMTLNLLSQIDDGVYVSPSWAPLARKHIMVFMDKMQTLLLTLHQQTIKVKDFKGKHEWFILPNGDVIEKWKEHVPRFEEVRELAAVYHLDKHWWGRAHRVCDPTQDECHYEKSFNKKYEKALKSAIGWLDARPNEIPARS